MGKVLIIGGKNRGGASLLRSLVGMRFDPAFKSKGDLELSASPMSRPNESLTFRKKSEVSEEASTYDAVFVCIDLSDLSKNPIESQVNAHLVNIEKFDDINKRKVVFVGTKMDTLPSDEVNAHERTLRALAKKNGCYPDVFVTSAQVVSNDALVFREKFYQVNITKTNLDLSDKSVANNSPYARLLAS